MKITGSKPAFWLAFIGGVINIIIYIAVLTSEYLLEIIQNIALTDIIVIPIMGILIALSSFWLLKKQTLKRGAITTLILGILAFNMLAIIGVVTGLTKK